MLLFRPVRKKDLSAIVKLTQFGGIGLTTLPTDKAILAERINTSLKALAATVQKPFNEHYFFVLEDTINKKVIGVTGINAAVGDGAPFYSYKLSKITRICRQLDLHNEYSLLRLVNDYQGQTEICSLLLHPDYHRKGAGRFLSRARFLFIGQFPQRFTPLIIAEMRGVSSKQGQSPFWENVGKHFFNMSYREADELTVKTDKQFIADLMPRHPIYIQLLRKNAQQAIGQPHQLTRPALRILQKEGFIYQGYVDIFDAGPTFEAQRDQIHTVENSCTVTLKNVVRQLPGEKYLLSNTSLDFRACIGDLCVDGDNYTLDQQVAKLLKVKPGDRIRMAPLHYGSSNE
ncbi:MAG: arginine N-succinyltransferase [Gammaproteobacteria bacterium]